MFSRVNLDFLTFNSCAIKFVFRRAFLAGQLLGFVNGG